MTTSTGGRQILYTYCIIMYVLVFDTASPQKSPLKGQQKCFMDNYLVDNNFLCRQIQVTVTHEYTVHVCLTDSAKSTSSMHSVTVSQMEG